MVKLPRRFGGCLQETEEIRTLEELAALEDLAAELLKTARRLRPGAKRHDILKEIGRFRARIAALRDFELHSDSKVRRVAIVEVTSPDGSESLWAVARPYSEAVAAVRMVIPPDHIAELSIRRLLGNQIKMDGLRPGEVRKIKTMTHSKSPSDPT